MLGKQFKVRVKPSSSLDHLTKRVILAFALPRIGGAVDVVEGAVLGSVGSGGALRVG